MPIPDTPVPVPGWLQVLDHDKLLGHQPGRQRLCAEPGPGCTGTDGNSLSGRATRAREESDHIMGGQDRDDVEHVSVHELWEHEAYDFTPWLAENLSRLGCELGLSLSNPRCEVQVGSYYLDILADEKTGTKVAIENQLKVTNIHHLGQLLTYTAGCDTPIGIWVAPKFRHEHAQALDWLNRWTADEISFYGVKIEAVRHPGASRPVARFRKVVWPGGWNQDLTEPIGNIPDDREDFFRRLFIELGKRRFTDQRPYKLFGTAGGRYYRSQVNEGVWYAASALPDRKRVLVAVHVQTKLKVLTKHVFDALEEDRAGLESQVNADAELGWEWRRHNPHRFSSILLSTDGSIGDGEQEAKMWIVEHLHKLKEVFDPRIQKILQESQGVASLRREDANAGSSSKEEAEPTG